MNKRILKLFNEAGFHRPGMERLGIEDKFEKFAELIVKECISVMDDTPEFIRDYYSKAFKQHFGVEE